MSFAIVTDSSSNLTDAMIEDYKVHILSLVFRVDGKEYKSYVPGEKTDLKRFYTMMRDKKAITTSLIDMQDCMQLFEALLKQGEDILYIGFSSALSGTYQAASMAADTLREQYPARRILTVDTLGASMGEGLLVHYACSMRSAGSDIDAVYAWLLENRLHLCHWFTVDDLFFLKRGGRVSGATALVGTMLGIKPVMHMDDEGRLILVGKARGRRRALNALVEHMAQTAVNPAEQVVFISHGDCIEDAEYVAAQIRARLGVKQIFINYVDPVIGAHSGPGTVALFFMGTKR
nr:DegV family protein [Maliibacterium massiliense]